MTQAVLEARDISRAYRRHQVLRGGGPGGGPRAAGGRGRGERRRESTLLKILVGEPALLFVFVPN
jgi:hypothetical protein